MSEPGEIDPAAVGEKLWASRRTLESIVADVDITWDPYVSQITAYLLPITLTDGTREGQLKKIYNDATGSFILVNCALPGIDTQVRINNNASCVLIWIHSQSFWRLYDGIVGITLQ